MISRCGLHISFSVHGKFSSFARDARRPLDNGTMVVVPAAPRGRRPKLGSPETMARRATSARKRLQQRARKRAGTAQPAHRPRKNGGSPGKVAARQRAWLSYEIKREYKEQKGLLTLRASPIVAIPAPVAMQCLSDPARSPSASAEANGESAPTPPRLRAPAPQRLCGICLDQNSPCEEFTLEVHAVLHGVCALEVH